MLGVGEKCLIVSSMYQCAFVPSGHSSAQQRPSFWSNCDDPPRLDGGRVGAVQSETESHGDFKH